MKDQVFYPFKSHPILSSIDKQFRLMGVDGAIIKLFQENVLFIYPKIFSVSILAYPPTLNRYDFFCDAKPLNEEEFDVFVGESDYKKEDTIMSREKIVEFFDYLVKAFEILNLSPIVISDFRGLRIFDEILISEIVNKLKNVRKLMMLCPDESLCELTIFENVCRDGSCEIIRSIPALFSSIKEFIHTDGNVLELEFSGYISLSYLEKRFKEINFPKCLTNKFLITIDLSNATDIGFFSTNILSTLMHTIGHNYGLVWSIKDDRKKSKIKNRLNSFRFFEVNRFFLTHRDNPFADSRTEETIRQTGIHVFDNSTFNRIITESEGFIREISEMFSEYLSQYERMSQIIKHQSRRQPYSQQIFPRKLMIRNLIYELAENARRHSDGVGYFAAEIGNYQIRIFIGDTGIGLKRGILRNYNLENEIQGDQEALIHIFDLYNFKNRKKGQNKDSMGGGYGLIDSLSYVFALSGKFVFRTGNMVGYFMNPVLGRQNLATSTIKESSFYLDGTQYMIIIPLTDDITGIPSKYYDFLATG